MTARTVEFDLAFPMPGRVEAGEARGMCKNWPIDRECAVISPRSSTAPPN